MMLCAVSDSDTVRSCSVLRAFSSSTTCLGTFFRLRFRTLPALASGVKTGTNPYIR